eukprot:15364987-Ditylum_brightwellii.AAC.1
MQYNTKNHHNTVKKDLDIARCTARRSHLEKHTSTLKVILSKIIDPDNISSPDSASSDHDT